MTFELSQLFAACLGYLLLLFGIAHAAEKQWIPARIVRHPVTSILSLGVFAHAWALYGVVTLAHYYGYGFLAYYLGIAATFLLAPLLLIPLWRLSRQFMLSSLADLLAFRYRSQWAGSLATLCMLTAALPLLALQIQAMTETATILSSEQHFQISSSPENNQLALFYCLLIAAFAMLFGAKQLTAHERHNGLVTAVAFESLLKVLVLLSTGLVSVYAIFGGFEGLSNWLQANPNVTEQLTSPSTEDAPRTLLIIFFCSVVVMPHLFHMIMVETPSVKTLRIASWGAPLLLLLLSLPVLPILWGGYNSNTALPPEYFTLSIGMDQQLPALTLLIFVSGVSAASSVIIVMTLALASMCLKHLILPLYRPSSEQDLHRQLLWLRRLLTLGIIIAGYIFYLVMVNREALSNLGLAAFIAALQLFPGVLATLYWHKANSKGFIAGLATGISVWFFTLMQPIISDSAPDFLNRFFNYTGTEAWHVAALLSLSLNTIVFITVSMLGRSNRSQREAAEACSIDDLSRPLRRLLSATSAQEMQARLATALGQRSAEREVQQALSNLGMKANENRPYALRLLRNCLEANLSNLMGPSVAREMVEQLLPYEKNSNSSSTEDINLIERQLEEQQSRLTGLAADLDSLRRHHRRMLQELPAGVCSLGNDLEVLMWNNAIAEITGIGASQTVGAKLSTLPQPWRQLLEEFIEAPEQHRLKQQIDILDEPLWVNLHKTATNQPPNDGQVIVMEDATDLQRLEHKLTHSERLAAIGQLAAGVAHEIGNPVTGIACLAQNLRYDTDNPDSLATAEEILSQTQRVTRIVQTLVNFAHTGQGDGQHQLEAVNLQHCADEAIHLLTLNKEAKPIEIVNQCQPHFALADQQRLLQVLINLINNARDASPANSLITLSSQLKHNTIEFSVTDQGCGISQALQEKIFDPFFTTKEVGEGTGLGLYLVYNIIEEMDGDIWVQSPVHEQHNGSRFTIQLTSASPATD